MNVEEVFHRSKPGVFEGHTIFSPCLSGSQFGAWPSLFPAVFGSDASVRVHLWCCAFRVDEFPERRKDTKNEQCKKYEKFLDGIETRTMKIRMASWH